MGREGGFSGAGAGAVSMVLVWMCLSAFGGELRWRMWFYGSVVGMDERMGRGVKVLMWGRDMGSHWPDYGGSVLFFP